MKKVLLLIIVLGLCGCSSKNAAGGTSGKVDCYSIRVMDGGISVMNETYSSSYSGVYEYKSANGDRLYASSYNSYRDTDGQTMYSSIRVYNNGYDKNYKEYTYSRFVGYLVKEINYYLDLGPRIVDQETKWTEYKYSNNPVGVSDDVVPNNKEAYSCAKKGFYEGLSFSYTYYAELRLDLVESSLERHVYVMLGEDSIITYRAKWL